MDFIDQVKHFAQRIDEIKDGIKTEEATKTAMIMPFFSQVLGYDVFNPEEFIPEFTADFGAKKGERVDYAIRLDGNLKILVEAKPCGAVLDKHGAQLFRYFNSTKAKFGILTDGIIYRFFTDLEQDNIMDDTPFFEFNFIDYTENDVDELKRFKKSQFDADKIASTASKLKYIGLIKDLLARNSEEPEKSFVKYVMGEVYEGQKNQNAITRFTPIVKTALNEYINDVISEKISVALTGKKSDEIEETPVEESIEEEIDNGIVTTEKEMEAFYSVRTIVSSIIPREDVTYKDTRSYFGIIYKNNSWKWICRFQFRKNDIVLKLPDENKKEIVYKIASLDEIIQYKNELKRIASEYAGKNEQKKKSKK